MGKLIKDDELTQRIFEELLNADPTVLFAEWIRRKKEEWQKEGKYGIDLRGQNENCRVLMVCGVLVLKVYSK